MNKYYIKKYFLIICLINNFKVFALPTFKLKQYLDKSALLTMQQAPSSLTPNKTRIKIAKKLEILTSITISVDLSQSLLQKINDYFKLINWKTNDDSKEINEFANNSFEFAQKWDIPPSYDEWVQILYQESLKYGND
jgi:hypothetical protein